MILEMGDHHTAGQVQHYAGNQRGSTHDIKQRMPQQLLEAEAGPTIILLPGLFPVLRLFAEAKGPQAHFFRPVTEQQITQRDHRHNHCRDHIGSTPAIMFDKRRQNHRQQAAA